MASDSATTQQMPRPDGTLRTSSIWNSANKIVNLRKTWPVGAMTFGRATYAGRSIATHCKDLRGVLCGEDVGSGERALSYESYTVESIATRLLDHFRPLHAGEPGGMLGFLVGGFSAAERSPEMWQVLIGDDGEEATQLLPPGEAGIFHQGVTDAITRLVDGAGQDLAAAFTRLGMSAAQAEPAAEDVRALLSVPWAWSGMPVGETIDMARFLVDTTINFVRFTPGDATVGGPIEIAALTKHEGFKWVQRKHYYRPELNPTEVLG